MAQQGPPPSRSSRRPGPSPRRGGSRPERHYARDAGPRRYSWDDGPSLGDEGHPPWAGMAVVPKRARQEADGGEPGTGHGAAGDGRGPGFRSRAGAARARQARLKLYIWAGAAVAVAAIVAVVLVQLGGHPARRPAAGGLVTTYLPGELRTVPRACSAVSAVTLAQAMQGTPKSLAPQSLDGAAQSVCDWTVDAPPVYRHLEVTLQAYAPSGLATGDGSATNAARDAYQQALRQKVKPPKGSGLPKAAVTWPGHLGAQAFLALQRVASAGNVTDLETAVARVRNVLVTVVLQGSHTDRYGPVPVARLAAGAMAVAREALSRLG